tara:strand:- start:3423 stop:4067 length:645 start_codon:yes stop_codon:yes gene_type:complete
LKFASPKRVVGDGCESLQSSLLPQVFERLPINKRLLVLDVGGAIASTVNFLNQFKCRLSFCDLYAEDFVVRTSAVATHEERVSRFREALNLEAGTKVDICLFWDLFSYLDGPGLRALMEALDTHIGRDTLGYSIGVHHVDAPLPFIQYGIERPTQLRQVHRAGIQSRVYLRSQRDLHHLLGCFEIEKCRLLAGGRVEYLLLENRHDDTKPQLNF